MISHNDQIDLFELIARDLSQDLECYVFGGTAMMFYGYKDYTKDIDVFFEKESKKKKFVEIIKKLGFKEVLPNIYLAKKLREKFKPVMFQRNDFRFDLFVRKIFRTQISLSMKKNLFAVHDFKQKFNFRVNVLRKEYIVLLKSITDRQNDFDDIRTIVGMEKDFSWQILIDEAVWQHINGDSWVLLDLEKTMNELKQYVFIREKYFNQIYKAQK